MEIHVRKKDEHPFVLLPMGEPHLYVRRWFESHPWRICRPWEHSYASTTCLCHIWREALRRLTLAGHAVRTLPCGRTHPRARCVGCGENRRRRRPARRSRAVFEARPNFNHVALAAMYFAALFVTRLRVHEKKVDVIRPGRVVSNNGTHGDIFAAELLQSEKSTFQKSVEVPIDTRKRGSHASKVAAKLGLDDDSWEIQMNQPSKIAKTFEFFRRIRVSDELSDGCEESTLLWMKRQFDVFLHAPSSDPRTSMMLLLRTAQLTGRVTTTRKVFMVVDGVHKSQTRNLALRDEHDEREPLPSYSRIFSRGEVRRTRTSKLVGLAGCLFAFYDDEKA